MHICLMISSYSHISFITIEIKLNENTEQERSLKITIKTLQWKTRHFNDQLCHKTHQVHSCRKTFKNGVAFVVTSNLIEIHQNNSGIILIMNIELTIFYVISNME